MARRSGFCGTGTHERCLFISVNGARAATRYVACTCECHDGDEKCLETVIAVMGHWDDDHPASADSKDVMRYVDAVNAFISASRGSQDPEDDDDD